MKQILSQIISFVFPITCSACGADLPASSTERVCDTCKDSLVKNDGLVCAKCGEFLPDGGEFCFKCRADKKRFHFDLLRSAYIYKDTLRKLVLKFKYSDRAFLAKTFSQEMTHTLIRSGFNSKTDLIIPVPLNIVRRVKRGYNQAALLADEIAQNVSKPVIKGVLARKRITRPQFKLTREKRFKNIENSFTVKDAKAIKNKNILLIDDVATTCATASACAKVLKQSGASRVFVLTLARD